MRGRVTYRGNSKKMELFHPRKANSLPPWNHSNPSIPAAILSSKLVQPFPKKDRSNFFR